MVLRSACHPIFVGLGTTAILAAGASSIALADDSPAPAPAESGPAVTAAPTAGQTPTASPPIISTPPPPPPPPKLFIALSPPTGKLYPGDSTLATVHVHTSGTPATEMLVKFSSSPKVTLTPDCVLEKGACTLTKVGEAGRFTRLAVKLPKTLKPGTVTLTAKAGAPADSAKPVTVQRTFKVIKKPAPRPSPSTPSTSPPASGGGSGSAGGSGSGSGSGSGTGSGVGGATSLPPLPSAAAQAPNAALPPVAAPPVARPSVAPDQVAAPSSTLRAGADPAPTELTFERLAGTQAAWLAALLAALSLLLTQLRINRIAMGHRRPKGDHRRPRHGLFSS